MSKVPEYHTTKLGTKLAIRNLRGKPYLDVAQRLVWFVEENPRYDINTTFQYPNADETLATTRVVVLNDQDKIQRAATGIKRETKADFSDHTEKAQTSSLGRALAMLGYGTQFTGDELDEGERLADAPTEQAIRAPSSAAAPAANAEVILMNNGSRPSFKARKNLTNVEDDV